MDKVLVGRPVRGDVGARVLAFLAECGIEPLTAVAAGGEGRA